MAASKGQPRDSENRETYSHGYGEQTVQRQETRTAEFDAGFLLPHLKPGMKLLDCGCGSGSITIGLAQVVAPGEVVGIDMESTVIERAIASAADEKVDNVSFQTGDVYQLPFPDQHFDVVYANTVLEHLGEASKGLEEMRRILKSGGIIAMREMDTGGALHYPESRAVRGVLELVENQMKHNGGEPHYGRRLGHVLRKAGFHGIEMSANYSNEFPTMIAESFGRRITEPPLADLAIEQGWADREKLERLAEGLRSWGEHPDAFFVPSRCAAVGWKVS